MPSGGHRTDVDTVVGDVVLHTYPVAEKGAAGERAGWIDGKDRHGLTASADLFDHRRDESRLSRPRRSGDSDHTRGRLDTGQLTRLDLADRSRQGLPIPGPDLLDQFSSHGASALAMTSWT